MTHYVVWARPQKNLNDLRVRLTNADTGRTIDQNLRKSLLNARFDPDGWVAFETDVHLSTTYAQERALLEKYFTDLTTEVVDDLPVQRGWEYLPLLWQKEAARYS